MNEVINSTEQLIIKINDIFRDKKDRGLDCVINYDIQWNPVVLIQRFGRIKINSELKAIYAELGK